MIDYVAGPTIDRKCETSSQTGKSECTSVRQYALCNLQLKTIKTCSTFLTFEMMRQYSLLIFETTSAHTEEILRAPPPSLSCTEDEFTVLNPAESKFCQTNVPSKPWTKKDPHIIHFKNAVCKTTATITWTSYSTFRNLHCM